MQPMIIITPELTDFWAMKNQIDLLSDIKLITLDESIESPYSHILFDFTFDIFNLSVNPSFLYALFNRFLQNLATVRLKALPFSVIKHYPFSSSIPSFMLVQKIIDQFLEILMEFYNAHLILVPHVISRYSLKRLYNPVIDIIQSLRMGHSVRVRVSGASRYSVIYSHDLLNSLLTHRNQINERHITIEGNELSLQDIFQIGESVAGEAPIHFDRENFIHYHYPNIASLTINQVEYEFANIMIDLVNKLF